MQRAGQTSADPTQTAPDAGGSTTPELRKGPERAAAWARLVTTHPDALGALWGDRCSRGYEQLAPGFWQVTAEVGHIGETVVFREGVSTTTGVWVTFEEPAYACMLPVRGCGGGRFFGEEVGESSVLTLEPGVDLWGVLPEGAEYTGVVLPKALLLRHARSMRLAEESHLSDLPRILELPAHRTEAVRNLCLSVLADLARRPSEHPMADAIRRIEEHVSCLVTIALLGRAGVRGVGRPRASYGRITLRARDYVMSHPGDAPGLTELCEYLHVGVRTLNYAFHRSVGVSAAEYLRLVRLNRARVDLLASRGNPDARVAVIASRWGFWNASLFGRQYRELFGELPSATLGRTS